MTISLHDALPIIGEMERAHERKLDAQDVASTAETRGLRETIKQLLDDVAVRDEAVLALKREMATQTVEKARLEGYIARANEDDPQPPRPVARRYGGAPQTLESIGVDWARTDAKPVAWWNR